MQHPTSRRVRAPRPAALAVLIAAFCVTAAAQTPYAPDRPYKSAPVATYAEPAAAAAPRALPKSMRLVAPLPTGEDIVAPVAMRGMGTIRVDNPTDEDAVVKLVDGGDPGRVLRCVYLRAGEQAILDTVATGTYRLLYTTGIDWDRTAARFTRDADYRALEGALTFEEGRIGNGVRYVHYTIVLDHASPKTTSIAETIFRTGIFSKTPPGARQ